MASDQVSSVTGSIKCGGCSTLSEAGSQFCQGCGQALYEPCPECSKPVQLTQSFCSHCGADLKEAVETKRAKYQAFVSDAVDHAKQNRFEEAIALLSRVAKDSDFRYREIAGQASEAIQKIQKLEVFQVQLARDSEEAAVSAIENEDHRRVVKILQKAPFVLLQESFQSALERSRSFMGSHDAIETALKDALSRNAVVDAGSLINQLCELEPNDPSYRKLAKKIGRSLMSSAEASFKRRNYSKSRENLQALPQASQDDYSTELLDRIDNILWLREQLDDSLFNTPTLGRLSVRLAKDEPEEPRNRECTQGISRSLKEDERLDRSPFPLRRARNESWLGGELGHLAILSKIKHTGGSKSASRWGQFNVAVGLALQGLGESRVSLNMSKPSGLLRKVLKRKPPQMVWGIDVGSYGISAVCLQRTEQGIEWIDDVSETFDQPLCRPGYNFEDSLITEALCRFRESKAIADTPVWINFPAQDLINRFVVLPPVSGKQAKSLMEREVDDRIPFDRDELWVHYEISDLNEEKESLGRPSSIHAARMSAIESRLNLFKDAELNIAGMQGDSVALVNLLSFEFAEDLQCSEPEKEDEEDENKDDGSLRSHAVALVDCGAAKTSLILMSAEAYWIWTMEFGGEELTGLLARETKRPRSEAEDLKLNPHQIENPARQFATTEERLNDWSIKLRRIFDEAKTTYEFFDVVKTFACGGGCQTLRWFDRVLLAAQKRA
ncbi:MAG: pilus assembly protein PilM [Planctomycetota bacterium]